MAHTRTGSFPIGFRRGGADWQKNLPDVIAFARDSGFAGLDLTGGTPADIAQLLDAGLALGSFDLPRPWDELCSASDDTRRDAAKRMADEIASLHEAGAQTFFAVMLPEDHAAPRKDNLERAADGYGQLCEQVAELDVKIVLEGYPGPPPHFPALGCTPADLRLIFDAVESDVIGINYDPSHLVRMGIDPLRFIQEFSSRIFHVHAKDTELLDDQLYHHGNLQPATDAPARGFGGHVWRYTIPGHGCIRWTRLFAELADAGYHGMVCIELEDENFMGSTEATQRGLLASRDFLVHA